jgi:hypothetical protein
MGDTNVRKPEKMRLEMPRRNSGREGDRHPNSRTRRSGRGRWDGCRRKETEAQSALFEAASWLKLVPALAAFENVPVTVRHSLLFPFELRHATV